jgi:F-box-like
MTTTIKKEKVVRQKMAKSASVAGKAMQLQDGHNNNRINNGSQKALVSDDMYTDGQVNRLPKELILRIFSFLDLVALCRCASVCKVSFNYIGGDVA